MKGPRSREPVLRQLLGPRPGGLVPLAAPPQRAVPEGLDMAAEGHEGPTVGRHRVVVEEAGGDPPQPLPLLRDRLVQAPSQLVLDLPQLRPHAVPSGLPAQQELTLAGLAADEGEAEKGEGLRLAETAPGALDRREAAELDQAGLVRMQRQRELLQPRAHRVPEAPGVGLVLEADHDVVRVAHDDHVARGLAPSPALGPEVEDVVQVEVGEERRDHRPLSGPPVADRHDPVLEDTRPQPFPDQADDARVGDPVLQEADQPFLADRVEGNRRKLPTSMMFRSWFGSSAGITPSRIVSLRSSAEDTATVDHT